MAHRPSEWINKIAEAVASCMEAHSPMGAMGWQYDEDDEILELVVYPTPVELAGGIDDGGVVIPGFPLDLQALQDVFERVTDLQWNAQGF